MRAPWALATIPASRINTISSSFKSEVFAAACFLGELIRFLNPDLAGHDTVLVALQIGYQHLEFIPGLDPANLLIETLPRATLAHEPVHSRSANDGALV